MILIDTNILMYVSGTESEFREPCRRFLEQVARGVIKGAISTEILQEVLYRYRSINRWDLGAEMYDLAREVVPVVLPITVEITDAARGLMEIHRQLKSRDAIHAATVMVNGLDSICSYDADFSRIAGVVRIQP